MRRGVPRGVRGARQGVRGGARHVAHVGLHAGCCAGLHSGLHAGRRCGLRRGRARRVVRGGSLDHHRGGRGSGCDLHHTVDCSRRSSLSSGPRSGGCVPSVRARKPPRPSPLLAIGRRLGRRHRQSLASTAKTHENSSVFAVLARLCWRVESGRGAGAGAWCRRGRRVRTAGGVLARGAGCQTPGASCRRRAGQSSCARRRPVRM